MNIPSIVPELKVVSVREYPTEEMSNALKFLKFWCQVIEKASWYDSQKEAVVVVLLDTKLQISGFNLVSLGVLNEATVHPREVFRPAIIGAAYGVVMMHNHPSGHPTASENDRLVTKNVYEASLVIGIKFWDHIIVGDMWSIYSFEESSALITGQEPRTLRRNRTRKVEANDVAREGFKMSPNCQLNCQ